MLARLYRAGELTRFMCRARKMRPCGICAVLGKMTRHAERKAKRQDSVPFFCAAGFAIAVLPTGACSLAMVSRYQNAASGSSRLPCRSILTPCASRRNGSPDGHQIEELVPVWRIAPVAKALRGLRGVSLITATTLLAEIGDISRFDNPRQLMAYLGLVPSEHSSGERQRKGSITKTGNSHARRVLVEALGLTVFPPE